MGATSPWICAICFYLALGDGNPLFEYFDFCVFIENGKTLFIFHFEGMASSMQRNGYCFLFIFFDNSSVVFCVDGVWSKDIKSLWMWRNIDNTVKSDNTFYLIFCSITIINRFGSKFLTSKTWLRLLLCFNSSSFVL